MYTGFIWQCGQCKAIQLHTTQTIMRAAQLRPTLLTIFRLYWMFGGHKYVQNNLWSELMPLKRAMSQGYNSSKTHSAHMFVFARLVLGGSQDLLFENSINLNKLDTFNPFQTACFVHKELPDCNTQLPLFQDVQNACLLSPYNRLMVKCKVFLLRQSQSLHSECSEN